MSAACCVMERASGPGVHMHSCLAVLQLICTMHLLSDPVLAVGMLLRVWQQSLKPGEK
jgi:hypothetical protein